MLEKISTTNWSRQLWTVNIFGEFSKQSVSEYWRNVMQFLKVVRVARSPVQPAGLENQGDWSTAEVARVNLRTLSDRMEKVIYGSSLADKTNSSWKNEPEEREQILERFPGSFIPSLRFE